MQIIYSTLRLLSVLTGLAVLTSCTHSKNSQEDMEAEIVHEASRLEKMNVSNRLLLPGELEGFYETGVMAKVNGFVKRVLVDIGDKVSQGQLLVELEAPELTSQLAAAYSEMQVKKALFLNTKGKFVRLEQTNKTAGAVSPYDMDLAKTTIVSDSLTYIASISKYQSIKSLTDYLNITAPISGIITERNVAPGDFAGPSDKNPKPILKLKSESTLRLHVAVPEKHVAEIKKGDNVQFTVKSYPNTKFEGKITRVATSIDTKTRSEIAEIEINNKSGQLMPGMFAQVGLPIQRSAASFVVPQSAVVINMERSFVIKVAHGTTPVWVDVEKGENMGNKVEIFGALTLGDTILNTASDEIKANAPIKIVVVNH